MYALLKSGKQFPIASIFPITENQLSITFVEVTSYDAIRSELTVQAMREVKAGESDITITAYENFTKFVSASTVEATDGTIDVTFIFEKENEIQQRLSTLEERMTLAEDVINMMLFM